MISSFHSLLGQVTLLKASKIRGSSVAWDVLTKKECLGLYCSALYCILFNLKYRFTQFTAQTSVVLLPYIL